MDESTGVGVHAAISLLRFFQKPALDPFMTKANVHLDRPLNDSGWWTDSVKSDAKDKINVRLHRCGFRSELSSHA